MSYNESDDNLRIQTQLQPLNEYATSGQVAGGVGGSDLPTGAGNNGGNILYGTDRADTLYGGDGHDTLYGYTGQDALYGGAGDDLLNGGTNFFDVDYGDALHGGDGNDTLLGWVGGDTMDGGDGVDTVDYSNMNLFGLAVKVDLGLGTANVTGGFLDDVLIGIENVVGSKGSDALTGSDGANLLDGGGGRDILRGLGGDDTLYGGSGDDSLDGGDGNDSLDGGVGDDTLDGGAGDDIVYGGDGYDSMFGGAGNDIMFGGDDNDFMYDAAGNDTLYGGAGNDCVLSGGGNDSLSGGAGDDLLQGSSGGGECTLDGGDGNDIMVGGLAKNLMLGGDGNDLLHGWVGVDTMDGGLGIDTVDYSYSHAAVNIDLRRTGAQSGGDAQGDILTNIESVIGSNHNDTIIGSNGTDVLYGMDGNDDVRAAYGDDTLDGGAGKDTLWGATGANLVLGGDGDDKLYGQGNNDTLVGGAGADLLDGGTGTDTADYRASDAAVNIDLRRAGAQYGGDAQGDTLVGIERVIGSSHNDTIIGSDGTNYLSGMDGNDDVRAAYGNDTLDGGAGNDTLWGARDLNLLLGGDGDDKLYGQGNNDTLVGGAGADLLDGGTGTDTADYRASDAAVNIDLRRAGAQYGGDANGDTLVGIERVNGSNHDDTIIGSDGADILSGMAGNDDVRAAYGDDTLDGGAGNDTLWGATGANLVLGGDGDDKLYGQGNNDILAGGAGADLLDGGTGTDTADYSASTAWVNVDLSLTTAQIGGGDGNQALGDTLTGIENLVGSNFDDVLIGNGDANVLNGLDGNDAITAGAGDTVHGGWGLDVLYSSDPTLDVANSTTISGIERIDLTGSAASLTVSGDAILGNDVLDPMGGAMRALVVTGDAGDVVAFSGDTWTWAVAGNNQTLEGKTYTVYEGVKDGETVRLYIQTGMVGPDVGGDEAPVIAVNDGFRVVDVAAKSLTGFLSATDADNSAADLQYSIVSGPAYGELLLNGVAITDFTKVAFTQDDIDKGLVTFKYVPTAMTTAQALPDDSFTFTVSDGTNTTATQTFHMHNDVVQVWGSNGADDMTGLANYGAPLFSTFHVYGFDGNDTLRGGVKGDILDGGSGDDSLHGNEGHDTLYGGVGNDILNGGILTYYEDRDALHGGDGDDTLLGWLGGDTMDGGDGVDTVDYSCNNLIRGYDMVVDLSLGTAKSVHGIGADVLIDIENVVGTINRDALTGSDGANHLDGGSGSDTLQGLGGDDTLYGGSHKDSLDGGDGNDSLDGGAGDDTMHGGAGNDTLYGGYDRNSLEGDDRNTLDGGDGNDSLVGGFGDNIMYGGAGDDTLYCGIGFAQMFGEEGNDFFLLGDDRISIVHGGAGDDTVYAGTGFGEMYGDEGNDVFLLGYDRTSFVHGGAGIDTASYEGSGFGVNVDLTSQAGGQAPDQLFGIDNLIGSNLGDTLIGDGVANVLSGLDGDDAITAGAGDTVHGGAGLDVLYSSDAALDVAASTTISGVERIDLTGSATSLTVSGDAILSNGVLDPLNSGMKALVVTGDAGDVVAFSGDTWTWAVAGNNQTLEGKTFTVYEGVKDGETVRLYIQTGMVGPDVGGDEAPVIAVNDGFRVVDVAAKSLTGFLSATDADNSAADLQYSIVSGPAYGELLLNGVAITDYTKFAFTQDDIDNGLVTFKFVPKAGATAQVLTDDSFTFTVSDGDNTTASQTFNIHNNVAQVWGTSGADDMTGLADYGALYSTFHVYGYDGDDTLLGGINHDILDGGGGDDSLHGDWGHDTLYGGAGNDILNGGILTYYEDRDALHGGDGDDTFFGWVGGDTMDGGDGVDTADYSCNNLIRGYDMVVDLSLGTAKSVHGIGDDVLIDIENVVGTINRDALTGSDGANHLDGGSGSDTLQGLGGDDTLYGGGGQDTLDGGDGNDSLDGGYDNDILMGGAGADTLYGGEDGVDTLVGGAGADLLNGGRWIDTADYSASGAAVNIDLRRTGAQSGGDAQGDTLVGIERVIGSNLNDTIIGSNETNVLYGMDGNDDVRAAYGDDFLYGGAGNDTLWGATGANLVFGGDGDDKLYGQGNNDKLAGGAGADLLDGGTEIDTADYSASTAWVNVDLSLATAQIGGGDGNHALGDTLIGIENLTGSNFDDVLIGNGDANVLSGLAGDDLIRGGADNDVLYGGGGIDSLFGDVGDDILHLNLSTTGLLDSGETILPTHIGMLEGGTGTDTLVLEGHAGSGATLDLSSLVTAGKISGIERIDITGDADDANTLTLKASDVFSTSGGNTLYIEGNAGDTVTVTDEGWSASADVTFEGQTYRHYVNQGYNLYIDAEMDQQNIIHS